MAPKTVVPLQSTPIGPQEAIERAEYMSHLMQWIEEARMTLDRLADARENKAVDKLLNACFVRRPMDWTERESTALYELHCVQLEAMELAKSALADGAALRAAIEARHG